MTLAPGHVVIAAVAEVTGVKVRPTVVVSTALYHATRGDVVVSILTSQVGRATAPTDYVLQDWKSAGLRVPSAFRVFLHSLPIADVGSVIGKLSDRDWVEVQARLRLGLQVS